MQNFPDIDDSVMIPKNTEYREYKILSERQCNDFDTLTNEMENTFLNIHYKFGKSGKVFLENNPESIFAKMIELGELYKKQSILLRNTIVDQDSFENISKNILLTRFSDAEKIEYSNREKEISEKILHIKNLQKSEKFQSEKSIIFSTEYLENYKKFLNFIEKINRENFSQIICKEDGEKIGRLETVKNLTNHIVTSTIYDNDILVNETIDILLEFLKNQQLKYHKEHETQIFEATTGIYLHGLTQKNIKIIKNFNFPFNIKKIENFLKNFDYKNEIITAFQQEYLGVTQIFDKLLQEQVKEIWEIDPGKYHYNHDETILIYKHAMVEYIHRFIDNTFPKTGFSHLDFINTENISQELHFQHLLNSDKGFFNQIQYQYQLKNTKNALGKIGLLAIIPDNVGSIRNQLILQMLANQEL